MDSLLLESSPFHNPRLDLSDQNKQQKIYDLVKDFVLPISKLHKVMEFCREEMRLGLMATPPRKSTFYMCNTFITDEDIPDGTEEGDFLAMDLGGTNLRIHLVRLKPSKEPEFRSQAYDIEAKYRRGKSEHLFNFLADCLKDFIDRNPDIGGKRLPFGFTFSFGIDQRAVDKGFITQFSIVTDLPDAIGKDAAQLFRDAINRKGLNIDVCALLNDTTATLAYGMYLKRETQIGFILGSGTNATYLEDVERIGYMDSIKTFGKKIEKVIVNTESGFLGDNGCIDFAKTKWDIEVDEESIHPHSLGFEKMLGGNFIGDLVRRALLCLAQNNVFLKAIITDKLKERDSMGGADVSAVESQTKDEPVVILLNKLGYSSEQISSDDIAIVKYVCALVSVRNALLASANIVAVAQHIGKPLVRVAIDGSLYKKHPKLHKLMTDFIAELNPNQKIEIFLADQGSGLGSAFIAAVVHKRKQND